MVLLTERTRRLLKLVRRASDLGVSHSAARLAISHALHSNVFDRRLYLHDRGVPCGTPSGMQCEQLSLESLDLDL